MDSLANIINRIWAITLEYSDNIVHIAGGIISVILFLVIIYEAMNIAQGKGMELGKILITLAFIGVIVMGWGTISGEIYKNVKISLVSPITEELERYKDNEVKKLEKLREMVLAQRQEEGMIMRSYLDGAAIVKGGVGGVATTLLTPIIGILRVVAYAFYNVMLLVYITSFAVVLMFGPIFIIFGISEATRSIMMGYITNVFSYIVVFFCFLVVTRIVNMIKTLALEEVLKTGDYRNIAAFIPSMIEVIFVLTIVGTVGKVAVGMTKSSLSR